MRCGWRGKNKTQKMRERSVKDEKKRVRVSPGNKINIFSGIQRNGPSAGQVLIRVPEAFKQLRTISEGGRGSGVAAAEKDLAGQCHATSSTSTSSTSRFSSDEPPRWFLCTTISSTSRGSSNELPRWFLCTPLQITPGTPL